MKLHDLSKDVRRMLLEHWSAQEIDERLVDPEYFFDQVVNPHMNFLRRGGESAPRFRLQKTPTGEIRVLLMP